ncbi:MAG: hypothetical protein SVR81_03265 [Chloroflexota bacterium]|nr:hypothetical protein [Chloroflexota bacterium]
MQSGGYTVRMRAVDSNGDSRITELDGRRLDGSTGSDEVIFYRFPILHLRITIPVGIALTGIFNWIEDEKANIISLFV